MIAYSTKCKTLSETIFGPSGISPGLILDKYRTTPQYATNATLHFTIPIDLTDPLFFATENYFPKRRIRTVATPLMRRMVAKGKNSLKLPFW
jgi:hypothetical protein